MTEPTPVPTPVPTAEPSPVPVVDLTPTTNGVSTYSFLAESSSVKLTNKSTVESKNFGTSIAIDKETIIVGDPKNFSEGSDSGSVSIFNFLNDTWVQQAEITAQDIYQGDQFGGAVDIDGNTAVVGAIGGAKGAVYVFVLNDGIWSEQAKLIDIATDSSAQFGSSVGISGNTIVVGAPADDSPETDSGSVFVFTRTNELWDKTAQLAPSGRIYTLANNRFGESVSIEDNRIYIGATGDWTTNGTDSGVVYIFSLNNETWVEEGRLSASDGAEGDKFGWALSVFNETVVVGAPYNDSNGTESGAAYVFVRDISGDWYEETKLTANDAAFNDNFGWSVGVGEDLAIVGSIYSDAPSSDSGSIYTYERTETNWIERSKLIGTVSASGDRLGTSVSISDAVAVIGAPGHIVDSKATGAIHVFTAQIR